VATAQPRVLMFFFGQASGLDHTRALILAGTQAILLYVTLLPVRLCHWLGEHVDAITTSRPASTNASARNSMNFHGTAKEDQP